MTAWTKRITLAALCGLSLLTGCYHYEPMQVTLHDATTGDPVVGATVQAYYPSHSAFIEAKESTATTNRNGQASVMVATNQDSKQVCLYFKSLYLDDPMPQGVLMVPLDLYLRNWSQASNSTTGPTSRPSPLVVKVLTPEQYHKKYPDAATQYPSAMIR